MGIRRCLGTLPAHYDQEAISPAHDRSVESFLMSWGFWCVCLSVCLYLCVCAHVWSYTHTHVHACLKHCTHECGDQRSTLNVAPQELTALCFWRQGLGYLAINPSNPHISTSQARDYKSAPLHSSSYMAFEDQTRVHMHAWQVFDQLSLFSRPLLIS